MRQINADGLHATLRIKIGFELADETTMALAECPSCRHEVSREAKTCPNCGQPLNFAKQRDPFRNWSILISALLIGAWIFWPKGHEPSKPSSAMTNTPPPAASCKSDWTHCADNSDLMNNWDGRIHAATLCKFAANDKSKYGDLGFPWVYAFSSFKSGNDYIATGILTMVEKRATAPNAFNANEKVVVVCSYNLKSEKVENVEIIR